MIQSNGHRYSNGRDTRRMTVTSNTLVTVDEAAEELHIKPGTIRTWIERGFINRLGFRPQPMGRPRTVIDIDELRRFLETRHE